MIPIHTYVKAGSKILDAVYYDGSRQKETMVQIATIITENESTPRLEVPCLGSFLDLARDIHYSWVAVTDQRENVQHFLVIFNRSLERILPFYLWRGSLVVMRGTRSTMSVMGMGGSAYASLSQQAVRRFLLEAVPAVHKKESIPFDVSLPRKGSLTLWILLRSLDRYIEIIILCSLDQRVDHSLLPPAA
ncbi:hypothetical protein BV25DRAFT_1835160 [Artomyces pyxidatus]|uniref:Uncharacterized protein n=1 Tax=Artomyces pyxidatus TaxID=48021 RepID=A0ACB8TGI5_9AGAM|nr:hypothetical protein BV25DRAFT_1835160 [Artomyces pyxidatus]